MAKPRIFLGSSGEQAKLLQALTRGLEGVARVEPWTTSFNPGHDDDRTTYEFANQVDFALRSCTLEMIGPSKAPLASPAPQSGQASPRDNVVFEAGLLGGSRARSWLAANVGTLAIFASRK